MTGDRPWSVAVRPDPRIILDAHGEYVGAMTTPELAARVVRDVNAAGPVTSLEIGRIGSAIAYTGRVHAFRVDELSGRRPVSLCGRMGIADRATHRSGFSGRRAVDLEVYWPVIPDHAIDFVIPDENRETPKIMLCGNCQKAVYKIESEGN